MLDEIKILWYTDIVPIIIIIIYRKEIKMKLNLKKIISFGLAAVFVTASAVCMHVPAAAKQDRLTPYQTSNVEIYNEEPEKYFTMMGINYTYGVKLFSDGYSGASECSFNLGGMYDLVTFDLGHIDGESGGDNPVLKIYYDGEYKKEIALDVNMMTNHISLNVSGVDQLRLSLEARYSRAYGMANATAYTYDTAAAAGETIPALMSSKLVYKSNLKPGYVSPYQMMNAITYEGDPEKYFTMMGINYTYGVKLFSDGYSGASECNFNLGGMYDLVTFDLGHIDGESDGENSVLKIYYDGEYQKEIALSGSMPTGHISLNVSGVDQLRFSLEARYSRAYGMANVTGIHNHTWSEEKTVGVQPTCVVAGEKAIYCLTCGEADPATVEAVPALGHDYVNEVCTRCGNRAVHKHKWAAEKTVSVEPTCELAGEKAVYCLTCGEADPATVEVIPALGHNYVDNVCTRCGKPEKIIPSGDVNNDGATNSKDLTRLMKVVAGEMIDAVGGDINGDGVVNSKDLTRLMKFIAGAISELE